MYALQSSRVLLDTPILAGLAAVQKTTPRPLTVRVAWLVDKLTRQMLSPVSLATVLRPLGCKKETHGRNSCAKKFFYKDNVPTIAWSARQTTRPRCCHQCPYFELSRAR